MPTTVSALEIDAPAAVTRIRDALRAHLATMKRLGLVVGMSGGVDSSVCAALAVEAVGPKHVLGLFMPERESDPESLQIATVVARQLGIPCVTEDISPVLLGAGCYRRRNEAIRKVVPEFSDTWGCKLVLPPGPFAVSVTEFLLHPTNEKEPLGDKIMPLSAATDVALVVAHEIVTLGLAPLAQ